MLKKDDFYPSGGYLFYRGFALHRWVAAEMLGRPLRSDEVVHHLNGNKLDGRPSNLQIMKKNAHHPYLVAAHAQQYIVLPPSSFLAKLEGASQATIMDQIGITSEGHSIRIDGSLWQAVHKKAIDRKMTISALITEILRTWLLSEVDENATEE